MLNYIIRRLLLMIPTLLGITLVVFFVMAMSPGGIGGNLLNEVGEVDSEQGRYIREYYKQRYGLDKPLVVQYLNWLNLVSPVGFDVDVNDEGIRELGAFGFKWPDLGESFARKQPVADLYARALPITLLLNLITTPIAYGVAILLGIYAAYRRGGLFDMSSNVVLLGLWSLPTIMVGALLVGFVANQDYLGWFPTSGISSPDAGRMTYMPTEPFRQHFAGWAALVLGTVAAGFTALIVSMQRDQTFHVSRSTIVTAAGSIAVAAWGMFRLAGLGHAVVFTTALCLLLTGMVLLYQQRRRPGNAISGCACLVVAGVLLLLMASRFNLRADLPPVDRLDRGWLLDRLWHLVLPVICMTYGASSFLAKLMRSSVLENISADFVRTARAKGVAERQVLWGHAFRNSLLPLITVAAGVLPSLLAGSVVIEKIFSIDGMGRLLLEAIYARDRELVMAGTLIGGLLGLFCLLLADLAYVLADPRVSYD